jgi:signal transduction histidine kinase
LSYLLHPPLLDEAGLSSALRWYVDGLSQRSHIDIDLDIAPDVGRLSENLEIAIFRIVQECLTNIHRHSGSATAGIHIAREDDEIRVLVRDSGTGIAAKAEPSEDGAQRVGVGISGMKERVRELGGTMRIRDANPGTIVEVQLPLATSAAEEVNVEQPIAKV